MLIGVIFVPGGHRQFILWYSQLFPFALEMLGAPHIFTFWIYQTVFPPDQCLWDHKYLHHIATLVIVALHLIKGTNRKNYLKVKTE